MLALIGRDLHGYGIKIDVEERTDGAIQLGSGTLYVAIQRLEQRGLVVPAGSGSGQGTRRRNYYRLTPAGKQALEAELRGLAEIVNWARGKHLLPEGSGP